MNDNRIGLFISKLRKEKNLTQKELANKLQVTDKAVSKWETGQCNPDISLLTTLANIFDVTTSELLSGERLSINEETESTVKKAFNYFHVKNKDNLKRLKDIIIIIISCMFLIAAIVCLICDFAITGKATWSLIVLGGVIYAWMVLIPIFKSSRPIIYALLLLSLGLLPYLFLIGKIYEIPLMYSLGSSIGIMSIITLWLIFYIAMKLKRHLFYAAGAIFLLCAPFSPAIDFLISYFTNQPLPPTGKMLISFLATILMSLIFFAIGYWHKQTKHNRV